MTVGPSNAAHHNGGYDDRWSPESGYEQEVALRHGHLGGYREERDLQRHRGGKNRSHVEHNHKEERHELEIPGEHAALCIDPWNCRGERW